MSILKSKKSMSGVGQAQLRADGLISRAHLICYCACLYIPHACADIYQLTRSSLDIQRHVLAALSDMAEGSDQHYDLTSVIGGYLDRHLVFPMLEFLSEKKVSQTHTHTQTHTQLSHRYIQKLTLMHSM